MQKYNIFSLVSCFFILVSGLHSLSQTFKCGELLGRPTDNSVTINACADKTLDVYYEYGTDSMSYVNQTTQANCPANVPFVFKIENLKPNTRYFYRMKYRETGTNNYLIRSSHTFHTQRTNGSTFTFAIEADPHLDANSNPASYALTLKNILLNQPDFMFDLGDNFMSEKLKKPTQDSITIRHQLLRQYYDIACHSVPLYLVIGNHEGELGWLLDGTAKSLPVLTSNTRKLYYPNPEPDAFYTGNNKAEDFVGLRQNYYSWEWGDALFIVLDPYWYTKSKPDWGWTLGQEQYNWFKNTISTSKAKFKFVFCHQLVGGSGTDGRGGSEFADFFEMGGENADLTWGFDTYRPGWEKSIHQLMMENNATIYFHGHDHCFAKQDKDGIVYQEVPQPSSKNISNFTGSQYGYVNGVLLPSRGYLLVTVSDTTARVDYIKTYLPNEENASRVNGQIAYTYTIKSIISSVNDKNKVINKNNQLSAKIYPNPAHQSSVISYCLKESSKVNITLYDILGKEIVTLVDKYEQSGDHNVSLNSREYLISSGIYYYRIQADKNSFTSRIIYME